MIVELMYVIVYLAATMDIYAVGWIALACLFIAWIITALAAK